MWRYVRLTYGSILLDVERLSGTRILITLKPRVILFKDSKKKVTIPQGAILVPVRLARVTKKAKNPFRYQIYSHGIYEAIRGRVHTILGYGTRGKTGELQEIDAAIETVNDIISILVRYTTLSPTEKRKLSQMLIEITSELKRKRNEAKKEAREFILSNEKHNRSYYTGFLGPVNINEKTNIFVNLRCLQLFDKEFVLYSGAGITRSSVARKEWEETDNKMLTMMNVMK